MPKREDIKKIFIIGSGPIVIGQACEFDYSGTQACKALKEEGYEVILVNSNPATIMTDPETAHRVYIEPITSKVLEQIIEKERPDALLPTLGGQTALNVSVELAENGCLERYGVELIGAKLETIKKAEDRKLFKACMEEMGVDVPKSGIAYSLNDAIEISTQIGFPLVVRPAFTLGGTGGGIAYNMEEFQEIVNRGLELSPISELLIEESVFGWKEYELEVMRDAKGNVVIICSIENFDSMGIHTGDSITVAPAQTLTDKEYQKMRDTAIKIIEKIGVETGGSNIQFAVNPDDGRMVAIEINPRVSRSSALASKATGFPIAKFAAKLAVGYTLDELPNDITKETPASFEPTIDYVVVKIPKWTFEKFPASPPVLTTQMKSVGEVMAIGRTFKEALQKAIRSLEIGRHGFGSDGKDRFDSTSLIERLGTPNPDRVFHIREAMLSGMSVEEISELTKMDAWFIANLKELVEMEEKLKSVSQKARDIIKAEKKNLSFDKYHIRNLLLEAKKNGFSDAQLAFIWGVDEMEVREFRKALKIQPVFKMVDTCGAEFEAKTPYFYSTYETETELIPSSNKKIVILGSGPNRIGQGIEFDYCCVHASLGLKEEGYETIMINSNPETVSTDYDISDRLFFEPLTREDVLNIIEAEKPNGVILQFGGQTPLKLAIPLSQAGINILGTSPDSIDLAEDRGRFSDLLREERIPQAPYGMASSYQDAAKIAKKIGYPVLIRPSYVLGGRAMEIVYDKKSLEKYVREAAEISPQYPVLIDKFIEGAIEVDVDAISDGSDVIICGIMEHIEEAGIHSGDSSCVMPPYSLNQPIIDIIQDYTVRITKALNVIGLINIQYAVRDGIVYVLEANPRASRTVPFVSKTTGIPWAKIAVKLMIGATLKSLGIKSQVKFYHTAIKQVVFPFSRFPEVDTILGPEMKSTGEVMGIDDTFGLAYVKSNLGAGIHLPSKGNVFISVNDKDKSSIIPLAKRLSELGFKLYATTGTTKLLSKSGLKVTRIYKVGEGRPNVVDYIKNGQIDLIINTPLGKKSKFDEVAIRKNALFFNIPCITTISAVAAAISAIEAIRESEKLKVGALQDYHH
jgi:carbamoyl-phosphate synthase large subunit